ncbi:MAG: hypothetical protein E4H00_07320 [Myxococcales bacterium]|nr:MAG: hypothetical protein E4H00_07320 [Myxococcales bacterium]
MEHGFLECLLDAESFVPAPGQGALAIESLAANEAAIRAAARIHHAATYAAVETEREFLRVLGGGCSVPIAAYARVWRDEIRLVGLIASSDGKQVIITETGWPTVGSPFGSAIPSYDHALEYFIRTYQWAREDGVEILYFSSFDESWKVGDEGDVGAYWGLWDADGNPKFV